MRVRHLAGLLDLQADALRASNAARGVATSERFFHRRAMHLPAPRAREENRSRHRDSRSAARAHPRCPRWWEAVPARKASGDLLDAPRWRDLAEEGLVYMHVAAGYRFGRVLAFTLNLTATVEAKARTKPDPAAWLRDLIGRHLKAALGRRVEVMVSLEENGLGALHAHGIVAGTRSAEDGDVRDALKLCGGHGYRGVQVVLKANPDSGWASYLAKDYRKPFAFGRFAATRALRTAAEEVFGELRALLLNYSVGAEGDKSKLTVGKTATLAEHLLRLFRS